MEKLLVDTAGSSPGAAIFRKDRCLAEVYAEGEKVYNRAIIRIIDEALKKAGLTLRETKIFGAVLGPGSFTGIRVGMAVGKAFAWAAGSGFAGVSSLEIMANSVETGEGGVVYPVIDAARGEVYTCGFRKENNKLTRISPYITEKTVKFMEGPGKNAAVVASEENNILVELLSKNSKIDLIVTGRIKLKIFNEIIEKEERRPLVEDVFRILPVYIRKSDAEVNLKNKKRGKK